jgi:hypothetical protein
MAKDTLTAYAVIETFFTTAPYAVAVIPPKTSFATALTTSTVVETDSATTLTTFTAAVVFAPITFTAIRPKTAF